jgi:carbonic anhydrase
MNRALNGLVPALIVVAACARGSHTQPPMVPEGGGAHWGYSGEAGPPRWGGLRPEFAACSTGRRQSPIDLGPATRQDLVDIQFDYRGAAAAIVNNGHTIQVDLDPGSSIGEDGVRYELAQFHFHVPSEHTVGGQAAPAEVHLVHKSPEGGLAVVGVLIQEGATHPAMTPLWGLLPSKVGPARRMPVEVQAADLLPATRRTFRYDGSLTTPPCTEGVRWLIMVDPIAMSGEQIQALSRIVSPNARPVHPLAGRSVVRDTT